MNCWRYMHNSKITANVGWVTLSKMWWYKGMFLHHQKIIEIYIPIILFSRAKENIGISLKLIFLCT